MLDYVQVNKTTVLVEDVFKFETEKFNKLIENEKIIQDLESYSYTKKKFVEQNDEFVKTVTMFKTVITNCLIYGELELGKDLIEFSKEDIVKMFRIMTENKIIKSSMTLKSYAQVVEKILHWSYKSEYRHNYYTYSNIMDFSKQEYDTSNVMTVGEMKYMFNKIEVEQYRMGLFAILEGIKTPELLSVKIDDVKNITDDNILKLKTREVKVSDELKQMMIDYSNTKKTTLLRGRVPKEIKFSLVDTGYLIRPVYSIKQNDGEVSNASFASGIRTQLSKVGVVCDSRLFRTYAMLEDSINGFSFEEINKKYNTNFSHISEVMCRDEIAYKIIKEKLGK